MSTSAQIALSYQLALKNQLDVTANNIANMSTPGFQGSHPLFVQFLVDVADDGSRIAFVEDRGTVRNTAPGPLNFTGNKLDVGIQGNGYFTVENAKGIFYTRNGSFRLDADGRIVTASGAILLEERDNPVVIAEDETAIEIARDGAVRTENGEIARIRIVDFADPQRMTLIGNSLMETDQLPIAAGDNTEIVQGMLEGSNVLAVTEITRMIELLRSYQAAAQLINNENDRQDEAIDVLTKTA